ncbi:uncharacterized protein LOC9636623 [Selaginella moellendorffii]|uniref:uncharacterized protein LOC9636623 n=1 Tax=Selaginella moellendorffii TaxID=88036 RepID=UPI000D1C5F4B|nr:uncharacterized protein LOC9636623 [Selaginella moellendorffii]|eukprot:XP_002988223.2 uncharacterized protein LOC9636623 [Selaginella moellendorffii]
MRARAYGCESIEERKSVTDDRADLCRKLAESRDREIGALKVALEARKCESQAIAMFNQRMKIDVCGMEDDVSGGHTRELKALRNALVAQEQENLKIMETNRKLQKEIERLKSGKFVAESCESEELSKDLGGVRPFEQCFIKLGKHEGRVVEQKKVEEEKNGEEEPLFHSEGVSRGEEKPAAIAKRSIVPRNVDLVHPWPEWVSFIQHLKKTSHLKSTMDKVDNAMSMEEKIKAAAMSFCSTHENVLQRLSQDDLMVFGAFGCPNTDRRIVNSGKRLRKYLNLTESDVCKFCSHSNICSRASCESTPSAVPAESSDILWLLLQFGFDAVSDHSEKRPLPEDVEKTTRSILQQLVFLAENPHAVVERQQEMEKTAVQPGNWRCTRCKLLNFSGNKFCRGCSTPCGLRTGEWKCFKCNQKNLARSLVCDDCSAPRPPKELRWGDWECPNCQGVNFARNKECFRCNGKQPPFKDRQVIGVNRSTVLETTVAPSFTLGVTPWLMTKEEKEASLKKR